MQRLSARFEGRVQGVGFRATVCDVARGFSATGRVRNVADGSVELQAEGDEAELLRFLQAIQQRMQRNIVQTHVLWREVEQAAWSDFGIDFN